jgi:uncharacterized protein (TIGR01777 family)
MFAYRHTTTALDTEETNRRIEAGKEQMKLLVSGSTGFIGKALVPFATTSGHEVVRLVRTSPGLGDVVWNPSNNEIDTGALDGFDGVVHLAGENLGARRWSASKKQRIRSSRVEGTRLLCETLAASSHPPKVLVCASAIGFYGDQGDEILDETSGTSSGFLAEVVREWEEATEPCRANGIRVVNLRIGVVLSPAGGVLARLLPVFNSGAAGIVGNGKQYVSWISMDDLLRVILHAIEDERLAGPVNAVAPHPVTNGELTKTLGRVLGRPSLVRVPAFALRMALGELAEETVLASSRVIPKQLLQGNFSFRYPYLEPALRHVLGKNVATDRISNTME